MKMIRKLYAALSLIVMLTGTAHSSEINIPWQYSKSTDNFSDEITSTQAAVISGGIRNRSVLSFICRFPQKEIAFSIRVAKFISSKKFFPLTLDYRVDKKPSVLNVAMYGSSGKRFTTFVMLISKALTASLAKDFMGGRSLRFRIKFEGKEIAQESVTLKSFDQATKKVFSDCGIKL